MSAVFAVPRADLRASRLNPVTKVTAILLLSLPVLITGSPRMAAVLVAGELIALPVLGIGPRVLLRSAWPFVLALAGIALANEAASATAGTLGAIAVRLVALALPGIVLIASTDPVDLADALVQIWHAPPRFAYGALAAFRLGPLLAADLTAMRRARRARGLAAGPGPLRLAGYAVDLVFALLIAAIRRGIRLATAMDARGFATATQRGTARISRLGRIDVVTMTAAAALAVAAVIIGLSSWTP